MWTVSIVQLSINQIKLNFIVGNTESRKWVKNCFENEAKVKLAVCNQKCFFILSNYNCKSPAAECSCLLYCVALLCTVVKYSMNNSHFSQHRASKWWCCVGVFWALFNIKREKGRVQWKTWLVTGVLAADVKLLMLGTGRVHVEKRTDSRAVMSGQRKTLWYMCTLR